jgi:hypothetical protein
VVVVVVEDVVGGSSQTARAAALFRHESAGSSVVKWVTVPTFVAPGCVSVAGWTAGPSSKVTIWPPHVAVYVYDGVVVDVVPPPGAAVVEVDVDGAVVAVVVGDEPPPTGAAEVGVLPGDVPPVTGEVPAPPPAPPPATVEVVVDDELAGAVVVDVGVPGDGAYVIDGAVPPRAVSVAASAEPSIPRAHTPVPASPNRWASWETS